MTADDTARTDVVVVGAGAAGLTVAWEAAPRAVTVLAAEPAGVGGATPWAQGGVAAAVGPGDDPALHAADTLAVGGELGDPDAVSALAYDGPRRLRALIAAGARFVRDAEGALALGREAGHGRRRVVHAGGDATGAEIARALTAAARRAQHVTLRDGVCALALSTGRDGSVDGVVAQHPDGRVVLHRAAAVVLATGGIGGLYARTTNPTPARGDGLALAAAAGAALVDLEFVQFHPTALAVGADPLPLVTEALRGEGARLVDAGGHPLLDSVHPDGDLAPRDVVARALWRELAGGGAALLDVRPVDDLAARFPTVTAACRARGIDPVTAPIPVTPAAHYHMGGIAVDGRGRTGVAGLWACGEVAGSGVHGANRLASNSLLEALVSGARVAADLPVGAGRTSGPDDVGGQVAAAPAGVAPPDLAGLRELMWRDVGLVRDATGLARAAEELAVLAGHHDPAVRRAARVAGMITVAAATRTESRGAHHRCDHSAGDHRWRRRLYVTRAPSGPVAAAGPLLGRVAA